MHSCGFFSLVGVLCPLPLKAECLTLGVDSRSDPTGTRNNQPSANTHVWLVPGAEWMLLEVDSTDAPSALVKASRARL